MPPETVWANKLKCIIATHAYVQCQYAASDLDLSQQSFVQQGQGAVLTVCCTAQMTQPFNSGAHPLLLAAEGQSCCPEKQTEQLHSLDVGQNNSTALRNLARYGKKQQHSQAGQAGLPCRRIIDKASKPELNIKTLLRVTQSKQLLGKTPSLAAFFPVCLLNMHTVVNAVDLQPMQR